MAVPALATSAVSLQPGCSLVSARPENTRQTEAARLSGSPKAQGLKNEKTRKHFHRRRRRRGEARGLRRRARLTPIGCGARAASPPLAAALRKACATSVPLTGCPLGPRGSPVAAFLGPERGCQAGWRLLAPAAVRVLGGRTLMGGRFPRLWHSGLAILSASVTLAHGILPPVVP